MNNEILEKMINEAKDVCDKNFCCKYSNFSVGAALLTKSGKIYTGMNIENDGIQSICAERVAFSKALSEMNNDFDSIVVISKEKSSNKIPKVLPCGYCRQFISEYAGENFNIYTCDGDEIIHYKLGDLLPHNFDF